MKKNWFSIFLTIGLTFVAFTSASAYTITFDSVVKTETSGTTLTSPEAWATVWDFNSGGFDIDRPGVFTSYVADTAAIITGTMSGSAAPARTDKTPYLAIPSPASASTSGYITINVSSENNYLGLYWGSIDIFNSISFYQNGVETLTLFGNDIVAGANGDQISLRSNTYVNIYGLDPFDSFTLKSTYRAFELDNLAVGTTPVPEPGTILLMGLGLAGLAGMQIKRKKITNS
jgi:hypothetical protein